MGLPLKKKKLLKRAINARKKQKEDEKHIESNRMKKIISKIV